MSAEAAKALLGSSRAHERLQGARYFSEHAAPTHRTDLEQAFRSESDRWVRAALRKALLLIGVPGSPDEVRSDDGVEPEVDDSYAVAEGNVTRSLMHELTPVLGALRLEAGREIANFDSSNTRMAIDRLTAFMDAVERLNLAASSARREELDLASLLEDVVAEQAKSPGVSLAGPSPMIVRGDPALLKLVLSNGLRNAIEASEGYDKARPIVINWGDTERDTWIAILDEGSGLPAGRGKIFDIGSTTKSKGEHQGMGLAIARRAAHSFDGVIVLRPREDGGTAFELRWSHQDSD